MISSQPLIDKICCALTAGGLTAQQCCEAENALTLLCQPVYSVATCASLPNATTYNGRMVYVDSENKYYYAVQGAWSDDFSSTTHAVRCDLYAWGQNCFGQLGDNTLVSKSSPVSVVGGFTDWCDVSAGAQNSLAVRQNGSAWAWGCNSAGQLGDNSITNQSSPVSVVGGFCDWCQVAAGNNHSLGVRTNGSAWAWGGNNTGQLGDNTGVSKSSPVSVVGGFTDWCQISAGSAFSVAVRQNGTAWAWGDGTFGVLGNNCTCARSSPVSVVGGFTDWCQVSSASCGSFSIAVRQNGTAWAWGQNARGQLGDNTVVSKSSPVSVVGGFTDWCQVSAGGITASAAIRQNGTAWSWGSASSGRLGDNTTVSKSSPVSVVGGFTDWCQIAAGPYHSLAVRQNGTAWAWGGNNSGQLGTENTTSRSSPVSVIGGFTTWAQVSAGVCFSLGRTITTVPLQSI